MKWHRVARLNLARVFFIVLAGVLSLAASAQSAQRLAIEEFFKPAQLEGARINPAATHVAFARMINGRYNLVAMELATRKLTNVAGYDKADIVEFHWINDKRLLYRISDLSQAVGDNETHGWYAAELDGSRPFTLSEGLVSTGGTVGSNRGMPTRSNFYGPVRSGEKDDILVVEFATRPFRTTLWRINSRDGRRVAIDSGGLTNVTDWALDSKDVARAVVTTNKNVSSVYVRKSAADPWRKVSEFTNTEKPSFVPIYIDVKDNLYGLAYGKEDTTGIYILDWNTGAPAEKALVRVKDFDVGTDRAFLNGGLLFSPQGEFIGVRYHAAQRATHWTDEKWRSRQEMVDAVLPGRSNLLSGRDPDGILLVRSVSDASPERFYLLDASAKKLTQLASSRPWIDEKTQARSDLIRYKARDGLTIPALLTLPRGKEPKNLPLIVYSHGGPWVRGIDWEWNAERQFMASRGYAVVEPDFRASLGHGWNLHRAGWKQWGLSMQDDLADAVQDLVSRGIVDRNRVCIAGASYGGYATVMGLIKHPDVYKCGVSWVGVTDMEMLLTVGWSDTAGSAEARLAFETLAGDPSKDGQYMRANSAIAQAARLKQPLIIAYGLADVRVPYDHGQKLRDALKPHNKDVQYIEYAGEGHGWQLLNTHVDFWTRAEKLFESTIGK